MGILGNLFGGGTSTIDKTKDLLDRGAVIIDVRTPGEFSSDHVKGSKNIPLQSIRGEVDKIRKMNKPVVVCCASGMRSAQAASILNKAGIETVNAGSWTKVQSVV